MTLPTGAISLSQVAVELGRAANAPISLLEAAVRNLAGIASGPVDMYSLRGKSAYTPMQASGVDDVDNFGASTASAGGTATANPSVNVSLGSGGYTFKWTTTSVSGTPSLLDDTSRTCRVTKTYARNSNDSFDVLLQCVITDSTGHSITVSNIRAYRFWSPGL